MINFLPQIEIIKQLEIPIFIFFMIFALIFIAFMLIYSRLLYKKLLKTEPDSLVNRNKAFLFIYSRIKTDPTVFIDYIFFEQYKTIKDITIRKKYQNLKKFTCISLSCFGIYFCFLFILFFFAIPQKMLSVKIAMLSSIGISLITFYFRFLYKRLAKIEPEFFENKEIIDSMNGNFIHIIRCILFNNYKKIKTNSIRIQYYWLRNVLCISILGFISSFYLIF